MGWARSLLKKNETLAPILNLADAKEALANARKEKDPAKRTEYFETAKGYIDSLSAGDDKIKLQAELKSLEKELGIKPEQQESDDEKTKEQKKKAAERMDEFGIDSKNIEFLVDKTPIDLLKTEVLPNGDRIDFQDLKEALADESLITEADKTKPLYQILAEMSEDNWEKFKKYT